MRLINPFIFGGAPFTNSLCIIFDGVDDYISTGYSYDATVTPNFSMSFWIKSSSNGLFMFPISMQSGGGLYNSSLVMMYNGKLLIQDRTGWVFGTNTIADGNWHNIIITAAYGGNTTAGTALNIYLDGNLTPDLTSTTMYTGTNSYLAGDLYMGGFNGVSNWYPATIDEVAVWQSILSSADITAIWGLGVPTDLASFSPVGWWRNGDGDTYPTITDHGSGGNNGTMINMSSGDIVAFP